jgi:hypothetical protein
MQRWIYSHYIDSVQDRTHSASSWKDKFVRMAWKLFMKALPKRRIIVTFLSIERCTADDIYRWVREFRQGEYDGPTSLAPAGHWPTRSRLNVSRCFDSMAQPRSLRGEEKSTRLTNLMMCRLRERLDFFSSGKGTVRS